MPGLNLASPAFRVVKHHTPESFLSAVYPILRRCERSSNIVLAHALKKISAESVLTGCQFITHPEVHSDLSAHRHDSFWLTVWSVSPEGILSLQLVLSCIRGSQDNYPIFLWTPHSRYVTSVQWMAPRISALVEYLQSCVRPERVFSVFGMTPLVKAFAKKWSALTGFQIESQPFYAAYFTFCTKETLVESCVEPALSDSIRRPTMSDLEDVARLCKEFADDSIYFPLDIDRARLEAEELISKGQIWLYESAGEVAAICAVTRSSLRVSAITKVYTCSKWRRRGFAEHLVRYVTRRQVLRFAVEATDTHASSNRLFECGKESVILYVGHENSAQRVYDRVGFVGLCGKDKIEGVEDALELGFVGTNRGHW
ncbi:hypothetical protein F5I97DRAFT_1808513 [Phlebopus sp. FC_14]|nr:hypothetical protein F5I97DRAFT_1808513 [Phlebopus sp. FC_14]